MEFRSNGDKVVSLFIKKSDDVTLVSTSNSVGLENVSKSSATCGLCGMINIEAIVVTSVAVSWVVLGKGLKVVFSDGWNVDVVNVEFICGEVDIVVEIVVGIVVDIVVDPIVVVSVMFGISGGDIVGGVAVDVELSITVVYPVSR